MYIRTFVCLPCIDMAAFIVWVLLFCTSLALQLLPTQCAHFLLLAFTSVMCGVGVDSVNSDLYNTHCMCVAGYICYVYAYTFPYTL